MDLQTLRVLSTLLLKIPKMLLVPLSEVSPVAVHRHVLIASLSACKVMSLIIASLTLSLPSGM